MTKSVTNNHRDCDRTDSILLFCLKAFLILAITAVFSVFSLGIGPDESIPVSDASVPSRMLSSSEGASIGADLSDIHPCHIDIHPCHIDLDLPEQNDAPELNNCNPKNT
ncbi:MAG: hypothetical protein ABIC95_01980 [archaeon]